MFPTLFRLSDLKVVMLLCVAVELCSCSSKNSSVSVLELSNDEETAYWIGNNKPVPDSDSLFYLDDPAPLFRKEFVVDGDLKSAWVQITAAGYYHANINGQRVEKNMLDPAWTDFSKRIYYSEYDITDLLDAKENCIGVTLGNGFYNPLPLKMWGRRNLRDVMHTGRPVFIGKIVLEYTNGETEEIGTDETWKYADGPLLKNNVYLGEVYDARKEVEGWDVPGFDDSSWNNAVRSDGPGGKLQKAFFPPIRVTERIRPEKIYSSEKGIWMVDLGVNFAGTFRIKLTGEPGDSVVFRFGERIYPDGTLNPMTTVCGQIKKEGVGGPGAPVVAWQTDTYILGHQKEAWYQPEFTFHTFRYMEIKGLKKQPGVDEVEGLALNTNVASSSHFSCSSELLNSIQDATQRTFLANLISVQSDCPAREKFGYGGDLNATSEAYIYNFDMQSFYRKTIYDWVDAMNDSVFVDTAPYVGIQYCGLSWESAFLTTQYYLYLYYNDLELVREMYEFNKKWMEKVARIHPENWVDSGLGDHESLVPVPVELTGTSHYLLCAEIMQKFASVMSDKEGEKQYQKLAAQIKQRLKQEFWDKPVTQEINRQTLFSTLLYYNVVPEEETEAAVDSLLAALENAPSHHFTTGIFGTKYILEALSKYVSPERVFQIVNSTEYPGWGFMIANGATTLWETWKESDNIYSNCHPMFGSVSEWFYRWLGGIQPDPEFPGFRKFTLAPGVPENMDFVNSGYTSPFGRIQSDWKKDENKVVYSFEIPRETSAVVKLKKEPAQSISIIKEGDKSFVSGSVSGLSSGQFELTEGKYRVTVQ
ncbi:alpha-L-rhamnosidase [Mariniphaga anaerophila]|uniref:alpha-L-rhamnosidase n=1 Tax=Mariniphaga anaerophila TaxID=1484053 RepID=A0A1M5EZN0_9BACT|nr:family 78 glycoside hydrolase catalytic domain [Mariniphaga anaerophila]SHF84462.1 alpha-L-rhamnosidase [Mariniphaga anaerophila]